MRNLRKALLHAAMAGCLSTMLCGIAIADEASTVEPKPAQQTAPLHKPLSATKPNQKASVTPPQENEKAEKVTWTVQAKIDDNVLIVNNKGEIKPVRIGSEIDGCLVTEESIVCDPSEKDKARRRLAENGEVQQLRKKVESAVSFAAKKADEIKRLSLLSSDLSGKLKKAENDLDSARRDLADKRKEADVLKGNVRDLSSAQSEVEALKRKLAVTEKALQDKQTENATTAVELRDAQQLRKDVEAKNAAMETLKRDLGSAQVDCKKKEAEVKRLTLLTSDISGQLKKALEDGDKAREDLTQKTQELVALKETGGQGKVEDLNKKLAALDRKLQEKIAEAEAKSAQLRSKEGELLLAKQQGNDADSLYRQLNSEFEAYKSTVAGKDNTIAHMDMHIRRLESQSKVDMPPVAAKAAPATAPLDKDKQSIVNALVASGKKLRTLEIGDVEIAYIGDDVYLRVEQQNNIHAEAISKIAKKEFKNDKYAYYVIAQSFLKVN